MSQICRLRQMAAMAENALSLPPESDHGGPANPRDKTMAGFKDLDFNERRASAQKAREAALAKLKARPVPTEAELARRRAAAEAREAAQAEKRHAAAQAKAKAAEEEEAARAAASEASAAPSASHAEPTEAERKAARDAKYAARKKNKARNSR